MFNFFSFIYFQVEDEFYFKKKRLLLKKKVLVWNDDDDVRGRYLVDNLLSNM